MKCQLALLSIELQILEERIGVVVRFVNREDQRLFHFLVEVCDQIQNRLEYDDFSVQSEFRTEKIIELVDKND